MIIKLEPGDVLYITTPDGTEYDVYPYMDTLKVEKVE